MMRGSSVVVSYHLFALFQGEIRILIFIDADAYDDFVHKSQCTLTTEECPIVNGSNVPGKIALLMMPNLLL